MEQDLIKIGIITTPEGESVFESVLTELGNVQGKIMIYLKEEEIEEIIKNNQPDLDALLFGGPLSYQMNRKYVNEDIPTLCIEYKESELMTGLLQWRHESNKKLKGVSLDTFREQVVQDVFNELEIPRKDVYLKEFTPNEHPSHIINFHLKLWEEKKVQWVITCRRSVFLALKELGVPVKKVLPTRSNIRESLFKTALMGEKSKNIDFQLAVAIFSLNPGGKEKPSDYEQKKLTLDFQRILVDIAQKMDASIVPLNSFEFLLYTNRGLLDEITRLWMEAPIISEMEKQLSSRVDAGFGVGRTALSAQNHAKLALERAKSQGAGCGFVIRDDGKIIGPMGKGTVSLVYEHMTEDPLIRETAEKTHLSIDTVSKVIAFAKMRKQFHAEELAQGLAVTTRNTRNILKKLHEAGFLREMGVERPYPKGRPRKIFALGHLDS